MRVRATEDPETLREVERHCHLSGPPGLRQIAGLHYEALSGEWKGYRSSRPGLQYRVIYRVLAADMLFQVISVTAHDYRRI